MTISYQPITHLPNNIAFWGTNKSFAKKLMNALSGKKTALQPVDNFVLQKQNFPDVLLLKTYDKDIHIKLFDMMSFNANASSALRLLPLATEHFIFVNPNDEKDVMLAKSIGNTIKRKCSTIKVVYIATEENNLNDYSANNPDPFKDDCLIRGGYNALRTQESYEECIFAKLVNNISFHKLETYDNNISNINMFLKALQERMDERKDDANVRWVHGYIPIPDIDEDTEERIINKALNLGISMKFKDDVLDESNLPSIYWHPSFLDDVIVLCHHLVKTKKIVFNNDAEFKKAVSELSPNLTCNYNLIKFMSCLGWMTHNNTFVFTPLYKTKKNNPLVEKLAYTNHIIFGAGKMPLDIIHTLQPEIIAVTPPTLNYLEGAYIVLDADFETGSLFIYSMMKDGLQSTFKKIMELLKTKYNITHEQVDLFWGCDCRECWKIIQKGNGDRTLFSLQKITAAIATSTPLQCNNTYRLLDVVNVI